MVARHEAGHAVVGTAVSKLLSGQPRVEVTDLEQTLAYHTAIFLSIDPVHKCGCVTLTQTKNYKIV